MRVTVQSSNKCPVSFTNQRCIKSQKYLPLLPLQSYSHSSYPVERCHCLFPTPQKAQSISIFCDLQTSHGWHTGRRWRAVALHGFQRWTENPALVKDLAQAIFSSTMQQSSPFPLHRFELVCWGFMTQARRKSADPPKAGFRVFPSYPSWAAQILFPCNTAVRFQHCSCSCFIHGDIRWGDLYNDKLWGSEACCWVVNTEWEWVRLWSACTGHQLKTQQILKDTPLYETLQYSAFSMEWCRSYMWGHFCKPKWKKIDVFTDKCWTLPSRSQNKNCSVVCSLYIGVHNPRDAKEWTGL